jgi:hypothetical protein
MEQSKFTGALANIRKPKAIPSVGELIPDEPPTEEERPGEKSSVHTAPIERGRGRPRAKSSDPDYQPTTVILRKKTKRTAARLLEDQETGQDLSELIEELLLEWIQKHS